MVLGRPYSVIIVNRTLLPGYDNAWFYFYFYIMGEKITAILGTILYVAAVILFIVIAATTYNTLAGGLWWTLIFVFGAMFSFFGVTLGNYFFNKLKKK